MVSHGSDMATSHSVLTHLRDRSGLLLCRYESVLEDELIAVWINE